MPRENIPDRLKTMLEFTLYFIIHIFATTIAVGVFLGYLMYIEPYIPDPPLDIFKILLKNLKWMLIIEYYLFSFVIFQLTIYKCIWR